MDKSRPLSLRSIPHPNGASQLTRQGRDGYPYRGNSFPLIFMKTPRIRSAILWFLALLALAVGCASTQQMETMLSAAGFRMVPATTPKQEAQLTRLPAGKVTLVPRGGTNYFLFPDLKKNVLYVGQQAQYQAYLQLRLKAQLAEEKAGEANLMSTSDLDDFGLWSGAPAMAPVYVR